MTNVVTQITNSVSPINGLDVVNAVNGFYSGAFTNIVWLLGILIGLLGIVVPAAYYLLQKRQLTLKEQKLAQKLEEDIKRQGGNLTNLIEESLKTERAKISQSLTILENQLKVKTAEAMGSMFHIQGNYQSDGGYYVLAIGSYVAAVDEYIEAGNLRCVQQVLTTITKHILSEMNKDSFEDAETANLVNRTISAATQIACDGLLDVSIKEMKKALADAQKREPVATK